MTEVAITTLLFGLGVFLLGFWASRKLKAIDAESHAAHGDAHRIQTSASHDLGRRV